MDKKIYQVDVGYIDSNGSFIFLGEMPYSQMAVLKKALSTHKRIVKALEDLLKDLECYCLNTYENMGRNPCEYCKSKSVLDAAKGE